MPPPEALRFESPPVTMRIAAPDDAASLYEVLSDPDVPFLPDVSRPSSVEQFRTALQQQLDRAAASEPAKAVYWVLELGGAHAGMLSITLQRLNADGGHAEPLLNSAMVLLYLRPAFVGQGVAVGLRELTPVFLTAMARKLDVEQLAFWADDDNAVIRGLAVLMGIEGPINHDHPLGLGFYRLSLAQYADDSRSASQGG